MGTRKSLEKILSSPNYDLQMNLEFVKFMLENNEDKSSPLWVGDNLNTSTKRDEILQKENLNTKYDENSLVSQNLLRCLESVSRVNRLYQDLEDLRLESFDSENPSHVAELRKLWDVLLSEKEEKFEIVTRSWEKFGFQGNNPCTDFRAGGFLSAKNLASFASQYPEAYKRSLDLVSPDDTYAPHAIVGIHVTMFVLRLFLEGKLHQHFMQTGTSEKEFVKIYSYIFYKLILYWISSKPESIFAYNEKEAEFFRQIRAQIDSQQGLVYLESDFDKSLS